MGSFWENIRTWCQYRDLPNMHLFHYNDLKRDLPRELRELAGFLDIPIDEARWLQIVESYTYDWMRADV
jgi:aryl sulfotransferase